jgi:hypothetical protein
MVLPCQPISAGHVVVTPTVPTKPEAYSSDEDGLANDVTWKMVAGAASDRAAKTATAPNANQQRTIFVEVRINQKNDKKQTRRKCFSTRQPGTHSGTRNTRLNTALVFRTTKSAFCLHAYIGNFAGP